MSATRSTTWSACWRLESTRARCFVVGEDLGTVPEGLPRAPRRRRRAVLPRAVVRARRRGLPAAGALSGSGRGLRVDARPADDRAAGGPAPTSPSSSALGLLADDATRTARAERERERRALRRACRRVATATPADRNRPGRTPPSASSPPTATSPRRRRRWCCCRPTISPARSTRSTCPAPIASGRTGGARSPSTRRRCGTRPIGAAARRDLASAAAASAAVTGART